MYVERTNNVVPILLGLDIYLAALLFYFKKIFAFKLSFYEKIVDKVIGVELELFTVINWLIHSDGPGE